MEQCSFSGKMHTTTSYTDLLRSLVTYIFIKKTIVLTQFFRIVCLSSSLFALLMKKEDLFPELVDTTWLLLIADIGILFNHPLVDLLLNFIQVHNHAVRAQGSTEFRNKPRAYMRRNEKGVKREKNKKQRE